MANQMIALQARNPQLPDPARATTQMANMINLASQQRAAQLQGERARQEMDFARAGEAREVELQAPRLAKAQAEATGMDLKTGAEFNAFVYTALKNADSPDQVVGFAQRIASLPQFQNPLYQGMLSDAVENMPSDPALFQPWKESSASKALTAAEELSNEFTTQNLGTSTRVIRTPKYGRGPAEVVEGSEAAVDIKPTVVNVDGLGPVIVDPNTGKGFPVGAGGVGEYVTPGVGGPRGTAGGAPAKGSVAAALQTNPGALKDGAFAKSQPGYTGASGGFATFDTPQAGIAAQERLLANAYVGKGFNTIDKIINRYAPQGPENSAASVSNYKKYVAQKAGVDINTPISAAQIPVVAQAMREFETGNTSGGGRAAAGAGTGTSEPRTIQQVASAADKARTVKSFKDITGFDFTSGKDPVADLIRRSTSGGAEKLGADIVGFIPESMGGGATKGMEAIGALEVIASDLTLALLPGNKLGAGVSNEDRKMFEKLVGEMQNPNIPAGKRLSAWGQLKGKMARIAGVAEPKAAAPAAAGGKTPVIPDAAKQMLRKNPSPQQRAFFDRTFGKGAAAKVLGVR
jgi:hypothetical protein